MRTRIPLAGVLSALVIALASPAAHAALVKNIPDSTPVANGGVEAIAQAGGFTYIGGQFDQVGPRTGNFVRINKNTGVRTQPPAEVAGGSVLASAPAPSELGGGYYIGGTFTHVGAVPRSRLAHIRADGTLDTSFNPGADDDVLALAVRGTTVYAGGEFTVAGGAARSRIAALDGNGSTALTGFNPGANGIVRALALSGTTLFVGGDFNGANSLGAQARNRIGAIDTTTGLATAFNPAANNAVRALAVDGLRLYVGGNFTTIAAQARDRVASFDDDGITTWNPDANGTVNALAVSGSTVYIGGGLTQLGATARSRLGAVDATTGVVNGFDPNLTRPLVDETVNAIVVEDGPGQEGTVWAGGTFTEANGGAAERSRLAALDPSDGDALPNLNPRANNTVNTLALVGDGLYVGGGLTSINGFLRRCIAVLNSNGSLSSINPSVQGGLTPAVNALTSDGTAIYAGGTFPDIGVNHLARPNIAKLNPATGNAFSSFNANANGQVLALAVDSTGVYAGGNFIASSNFGGQPRNRIAKLSKTTGNAFSAWNPGASGAVRALAVAGSVLYAGSAEGSIGITTPTPRARVAKLSASSGNVFTGFNAGFTGSSTNGVRGLAVDGSSLYVGGTFETPGDTIGGQARNGIAKLSTTTGNAFSAWDPYASGGGAFLHDVAVTPSAVYAGGSFTNIGGAARNNLAALSKSSGNAFSAWNPDANSDTLALLAEGTRLHVGGFQQAVRGRPQQGYTRFSEP